MQQVPQALKRVADVIKCFNKDKMRLAGATNISISSARTFRFDLPEGKAKDGINRVKVTNMGDGSFRVHLLKIEEVDVIGGMLPENLTKVISQFTGVEV